MKVEKQSSLDQFSVILKYDSRVATHNKRNGLLTDAELKEHASALPDSGGDLDHVRIEDLGPANQA
jgi:hypothetical protein